MADADQTLDELEKKLAQERREAEKLQVEIDSQVEATKPPVNKPDHASDGGVF